MIKTLRPLFLTFLFALPLIAVTQDQTTQGNTIFQKFLFWGSAKSESDKIYLYAGFTNGFFSAPSTEKGKVDLGDCIEKNIPPEQAVAMIDKYYKDNPQRWSTLLAIGITEALTVKDGPCPGINPWVR